MWQSRTSEMWHQLWLLHWRSASVTVLSPSIPLAILSGHLSQLSTVATEWSFPESFSQSTLDRRNGSNACAFLSLYFDQIASKGLHPPNNGLHLDISWKDALRQAIIKGNELHDLFDHEGVDLHVDDAAEMAAEECGILCIGQQQELFGGAGVAKQLLTNFRDELSNKKERVIIIYNNKTQRNYNWLSFFGWL